MTAATATAPVTGFAISVPAEWFELDLTTRDTERAIRTQLIARAGDDPLVRQGVEQILAAVHQTLAVARQRGAIYAASTYTPCEEGLFQASVMVSGVVAPPGKETDVLAMLRRWARPRGSGGGSWRGVGTVELPAVGRAVRVVGVEELAVGEATVRFLVSHTVIGVPGTSRHLVITCGSPNVDLGDELVELFDMIAATFRFVTPS